jgi:rfaE bifunctional protein nucleotidyltransferase chain/domain
MKRQNRASQGRREVQRFMAPGALVKTLQKIRRGKTVVFTNGCYDVLHVGHLKTLEHAKAQGDMLVVGLNADASVRRLKGPRRPIVPLADRARLMAALKAVDYVTFFPEDTPYNLIKTLKPDVLVKGADWAQGQVVGQDLVKRVVRVPLAKGRSTTGIIDKILLKYRT